jgi:hypothetical protein
LTTVTMCGIFANLRQCWTVGGRKTSLLTNNSIF